MMAEKTYTKEQVATFSTLAWREGQKWGIMSCRAKKPKLDEIHAGSLQYLAEKVGKDERVLDLSNRKIKKQLEDIL